MELLIVVDSQQNGASNSVRYELDNSVTLGRSLESPVPLDGNGISREHVKLHVESGTLFITDLSSNGTWLNTQRLTRLEAHRVKAGDEIQIPGFKIRISWPEGATAGNSEKKQTAEALETSVGRTPTPRFGLALSKFETILSVLALLSLGFVLFYFASS